MPAADSDTPSLPKKYTQKRVCLPKRCYGKKWSVKWGPACGTPVHFYFSFVPMCLCHFVPE